MLASSIDNLGAGQGIFRSDLTMSLPRPVLQLNREMNSNEEVRRASEQH